MCIVCNSGDSGSQALDDHRTAGDRMKRAADSMLQAALSTASPSAAKRYKRTHKAMVRMARDWNRLEQEREVD